MIILIIIIIVIIIIITIIVIIIIIIVIITLLFRLMGAFGRPINCNLVNLFYYYYHCFCHRHRHYCCHAYHVYRHRSHIFRIILQFIIISRTTF